MRANFVNTEGGFAPKKFDKNLVELWDLKTAHVKLQDFALMKHQMVTEVYLILFNKRRVEGKSFLNGNGPHLIC